MTNNLPTEEQVKNFSEFMLKKYKLKVIDKRKACEMKVIAYVLDLFNILDEEKFLKNYSTIIFSRIYLPWTIGNLEEMRLENQIATITHECQHSIQHSGDGFMYNLYYLFSSEERARYEAEAYRTNMELHYWYTGKVLSPKYLSDLLKGYACKPEDIFMAKTLLEQAAQLVRSGVIITEAGKAAINWLGKNMSGFYMKGTPLPERFYVS